MLSEITEPNRVRLAAPLDESDLVEMRRQAAVESGLVDATGLPFPFCHEQARASIQAALIQNRNYPEPPAWIGVIGDPGRLEGGIYLAVRTFDYSPKPFLGLVWDFVRPEFRKTDNARQLIAFALSLSRAVRMDIIGANGQAAKSRLYERTEGCKPLGSFFTIQADTVT